MLQSARFTPAGPGPSGPADAGIIAAGFVTVAAGSPTLQKGKNVTSVAIPTAGILRVTMTSAAADTNYFVLCVAKCVNDTGEARPFISPSRATGNNNYSTTVIDLGYSVGGGAVLENISFLVVDPSLIASSKVLAAAMFTLSGTTITPQDLLNVSAITRRGTGVYETTWSSALADADYSLLQMGRFANAGGEALTIQGNSSNTAWTNRHSTAGAVGCYGLYYDGSSFFDVEKCGALVMHADDLPGGYLAGASITVSGGSIASSRTQRCSIARSATGRFRLTFSPTLPDANYGVLCIAKRVDQAAEAVLMCFPSRDTGYGSYSTTDLDIFVCGAAGTTATDPDRLEVFVFDPSAV